MKTKYRNYKCRCGAMWQTWTELDGLHQTFNKFAMKDYKNPELKECTACKQEKESMVYY